MVVFVPGGTNWWTAASWLEYKQVSKGFVREKFQDWYSNEVQKQLQSGSKEETVNVDMWSSIMKEAGAEWLTSLYDYLCCHPDIIRNGFKKAGIFNILEPPENDEDPFTDCDQEA